MKLCKIGIHKSDKDYSDPYWGKGIKSHCEHCDKKLKHPWYEFLYAMGML